MSAGHTTPGSPISCTAAFAGLNFLLDHRTTLACKVHASGRFSFRSGTRPSAFHGTRGSILCAVASIKRVCLKVVRQQVCRYDPNNIARWQRSPEPGPPRAGSSVCGAMDPIARANDGEGAKEDTPRTNKTPVCPALRDASRICCVTMRCPAFDRQSVSPFWRLSRMNGHSGRSGVRINSGAPWRNTSRRRDLE